MTCSQNFSLNNSSSDINFQFGDKRVNRRANKMINKLSKKSGKSLTQAFCNEADLKGALRFFDNNLVNPEKILDPHSKETIERCRNETLVGVIQDSTDCNYDYLNCVEGFNSLHENMKKGLRVHPNLVITKEGTPLGILSSFSYTRSTTPPIKHRNSLPIEEKESFRWLRAYREVCDFAKQVPNVQVVSIADREGDIYECLAEAQDCNIEHKAHILVRSNHNRALKGEPDETSKLEKKLIKSSVVYETKVLLNRYTTNERVANVAIRATKVLIKAPNTCKKKSLPPIEINAVLVSEIDPPKDEPPLYWLLLTTLPINTVKEIQLIVALYAKRWCIEIFFKVMKSGCKIDTTRLQETYRIENYIAFSMIIAWKVMLTTYLPREYPNESCTVLFTEMEWKLAYMAAHNNTRPLPEKTPTLKEIVTLVAVLGGYQKRKDPPGIQTVWRGIVRLVDMIYGYELTHKMILGLRNNS